MEKERKIKVLSLVALIVAVLGLTVAFAALSQTLTINGTASVNAASWDVHFENLTTETKGDAKILSEPTIKENSTTIEEFKITLTKPGDSVTLNYDVANNGTIDAAMVLHGFNGYYEERADTYTEEETLELLRKTFVEADIDGDGTTTDEELMEIAGIIYVGIGNFNNDDVLLAGKTYNSGLTIEFNNSAEQLPKGKVTLNLNFEYIFSQR